MAFYHSRKILLAITLAIFLAGTSPRRVSGQNCNCPPGFCCSQWGYCGTTEEYCGPGCQEGPCNSLKPSSKIVLDASFNRSHPNQNCGCPSNLCCSQWGYCGSTDEYCGPGCQEGPCYSLKPASKIVRHALKNPSNQNCGCPPGFCCSQWGYCGTTEEYCGPGCQEGPCNSLKPGSKIVLDVSFNRSHPNQNCGCPPNLCCSQWGYCGSTDEYCGAGCQEGPCNSLKPTSKIVRHALKNPSNQNCGCPPGFCCSQWGYCGTTEEYCGPGCQEGPCNSLKPGSKIVLDASFNRSHPNQNCGCPPNLCCSQWGYCGSTDEYCGAGCQEGPCNSLKSASKIVRHALKNPSNQNCNCPPGFCCSQWGYCGTTEEYCGPGCQEGPCNSLKPGSKIVLDASFNRSHPNQNCGCPPNLCCSQWGYCGTGDAYCGPGCQEGPCNSLKPASEIVRHALKNRSNQNCNCPPDLCCSQWGYCGTGDAYCGPGCQEGPCYLSNQNSNTVRDAFFSGIANQAAAII